MRTASIDEVRAATRGHYDIEGLHAQGGMGAVYVGRHRELGSKVAIKVLSRDLIKQPERLARFKREAALAANLSHPHIVPVFEFGVTTELAYLVMPFVEGKTLAEYLAGHGRLEGRAVTDLVRQVGGALAFAHERGIVHRDIKPSNILREDATGRWMVTDFGVARAPAAAGATLTQSGMVMGTPAYMAPEQAMGASDVDSRADLYSLAAAAFEALTGTLHDLASDAEQAERMLHRSRPELSPEMVRALTAPLALDRARRPTSASVWLKALERPAGKPPGSRRWLTAVAALALASSAVGLWIVLGDGSDERSARPTIAVLPFAVTGGLEELDLRTALPRAFEAQLQWVDFYRVVSADRVGEVVAARFGDMAPDLDSLLDYITARFGATELVWGSAVVSASQELTLDVQVREGRTHRVIDSGRLAGAPDELASLVRSLVGGLFAERVAEIRAGWPLAIPKGLDAFNVFLRAESLFRRAAYDEAVRDFDEVIRLDSAYAPAYFKRMIAEILRAQPTRASTAVYSAHHAARAYRARLDPTSAALLAGYDLLLTEGDLQRAQDAFQEIAQQNPHAVDSWFILGYLQFHFAPLLGISRVDSRLAFARASDLDPSFAAAIAQLAQIAILERRDETARRYIAAYLRIDSTSVWGELARMADSLLYRGPAAALAVRRSFAERPAAALEIIGLAGGDLHHSPPARVIAQDAVKALWVRGLSRRDREIAFRMLLASYLGAGRDASADSLLREARLRDAPAGELDRWVVLTAITRTAGLANDDEVSAAARRLIEVDDGEAQWLAARWFHTREPSAFADARSRLRRLSGEARPAVSRNRSLLEDLDAVERLAAGDTAAALRAWSSATSRYSVEEVVFGLTGSLWPIRLQLARLATARGDHPGVIAATGSFEQMAGFFDQVAWSEALPLRIAALRATGASAETEAVSMALIEVMRFANGRRAAFRDSLEAARTAVAATRHRSPP